MPRGTKATGADDVECLGCTELGDPDIVDFIFSPTMQEFAENEGKKLQSEQPFQNQRRVGYCSGTLIDDNLILTAGHCIREDDNPVNVPPQDRWYSPELVDGLPGRALNCATNPDGTPAESHKIRKLQS